MNLLITAIGKRVQLIKHLKQSFNVIGVDAGDFNPAKSFVHKFYKVPKANETNYIEKLLEICEKEKIKVLIPLFEGEFEILHNERKQFKDIGVTILLCNKEILNLCKDKVETFKFFVNSEISVPKVYNKEEIEDIIKYGDIDKLPLIIKPKDGMGSQNVFKINNITELKFFKGYIKDGIVQEFIAGDEYTVDALVDLEGNPIYIVPRKRIEVRSGEVVKSSTEKNGAIIEETLKVINRLNKLRDNEGLALQGPLTIQFFKNGNGEVYLLEINPRFGGGVPLSFEAGADYGKCILDILNDKRIEFINEFKELAMLRYEEAVFTPIES
ncbi:MAG: ATP-grasp domain-containing protein [Clostridium beijerinckii]|jgi:carbamoyl-phosphate synthase large subunit|uniref:ATP-grasp domain-containing protein n=1 Tax=Clostridium beijerinckii TaxID=1520 RepID=UPI001494CBCD|nr:ATP-grasp domain-containing protein [Clostridium beijerinckii]MCI1477727.1 ATP-grasp domain-containing protein [Clostridium beijerinckii]MCI1577957.1 ATP-grasp domain-containing protein [Clostridium beijerinckii]MCI1583138.1 ATP-grasp domain-containing protein [Clostridium beijerinckii]MCI1620632.1 ATP-grasp domain-containing protein [Clostridium beijerinckii]NOW87869.1 carbamoyl-phosphate synthase large subunit [Clostridium beijerinckii]